MNSSTDKCIFRYRQANVPRVAQRFDYRALGSRRKLGRAAENLIDGSEKRECRLSFQFKNLRVIERRNKFWVICTPALHIRSKISYFLGEFFQQQAISPVNKTWEVLGTSLQVRLMRRVVKNVNDINLFLMSFRRMNFCPKRVPVRPVSRIRINVFV